MATEPSTPNTICSSFLEEEMSVPTWVGAARKELVVIPGEESSVGRASFRNHLTTAHTQGEGGESPFGDTFSLVPSWYGAGGGRWSEVPKTPLPLVRQMRCQGPMVETATCPPLRMSTSVCSKALINARPPCLALPLIGLWWAVGRKGDSWLITYVKKMDGGGARNGESIWDGGQLLHSVV